ncbi:unnamed protein product [Nesidiocoris tenuis]|uniref:Uncharacterized protein n=1 Tax=Nesidiocoris tenuis TaxID=355587 RepID=A0A6H5FV93_9HEMI|nr:unnamed protein product [Nesidiocoris tenuis]
MAGATLWSLALPAAERSIYFNRRQSEQIGIDAAVGEKVLAATMSAENRLHPRTPNPPATTWMSTTNFSKMKSGPSLRIEYLPSKMPKYPINTAAAQMNIFPRPALIGVTYFRSRTPGLVSTISTASTRTPSSVCTLLSTIFTSWLVSAGMEKMKLKTLNFLYTGSTVSHEQNRIMGLAESNFSSQETLQKVEHRRSYGSQPDGHTVVCSVILSF